MVIHVYNSLNMQTAESCATCTGKLQHQLRYPLILVHRYRVEFGGAVETLAARFASVSPCATINAIWAQPLPDSLLCLPAM